MEESVRTAVESWLSDPAIADADKQEIRELQSRGDEKELNDRFYRELEFGTGGLRGIIGAGLNRMNVYTLGAAAQGLASYIARQGEEAKRAGVAIAHDCRRKSDVFAQRTACVLAGNGVKAYLFEALRPTPELSFAVRHLGCTAGVVITASHNPPAYNGFKAYWSDGGQVVPPHDENIIQEVRGVGGFGRIQTADFESARRDGMIQMIGREVDEVFLDAVQSSCLNPEVCREQGTKLKIVFTSLHGTGGVLIPEALRRRGFQHVIEVPEQAEPDGEFPTVKSPNPEQGEALTMGIELARREGADLVIGTDPDADRVGIAVRGPDGGFQLVTGNQIAAMLTWYICEAFKKSGRRLSDAVLMTTVVSGDMMKTIARAYGADVIETLTGFKWIGERLTRLEALAAEGRPSKTYLFGAEESYGYMPGTYTRDKDAVTSAVYIADLAAAAADRGIGLWALLQELYRRFGYFQEGAKNLVLPGAEGAAKIQAMMEGLRADPPRNLAGIEVTAFADLMSGENRAVPGGKLLGRFDLPASNVILFTLSDGTKVIARPSGTEPKIKFYILASAPGEELEHARESVSRKIAAITDDLVQRAEA